MLWRTELRATALTLLTQALEGGGANVVTSKDQPSQDDDLPKIIVYTDDTKQLVSIAPVTSRTHGLITIEVEASGKSKDDAEAQLDALCDLVERTLFTSPDFVKLFEGLDSCQTFTEYRGMNSERHLAGATIEIKGHTSETWEPPRGPDMTGINVYVDSVNIFDPNSTYTGLEPFDINNPPVRTAGPDGRPEISATIDLPGDLPTLEP